MSRGLFGILLAAVLAAVLGCASADEREAFVRLETADGSLPLFALDTSDVAEGELVLVPAEPIEPAAFGVDEPTLRIALRHAEGAEVVPLFSETAESAGPDGLSAGQSRTVLPSFELAELEIPLLGPYFGGVRILNLSEESVIEGMEIVTALSGLRMDEDSALLGAGVIIGRLELPTRREAEVRRSGASSGNESVHLSFELDEPVGRGQLSVRDSRGGAHSFKLTLTEGTEELWIPPGLIGAPVEALAVRIDAGARIRRIEWRSDALVGTETVLPAKLADLGVMNVYLQAEWRSESWELFSWASRPELLFFDFADYEVQRRMFGRLGFFVAVIGEAGRLYEWEYYEGRHSYNAHDYRPEDLARFFTTAASNDIALSEEEAFLRTLLLDYGMIRRESDGRYTGGTGAVLSFSRETWRPLRRRLLRHEALHGLFYVVPEFVDEMYAAWDSLSPASRSFLTAFLANKGRLDGRAGYDGYAVDRRFLLVNEAMAHVLQLEASEVEPYFRYYARRLAEVSPPDGQAVAEALNADPGMFESVRARFEGALREATGIAGAELLTLYPMEASQ